MQNSRAARASFSSRTSPEMKAGRLFAAAALSAASSSSTCEHRGWHICTQVLQYLYVTCWRRSNNQGNGIPAQARLH
jgi:hypothetical protein